MISNWKKPLIVIFFLQINSALVVRFKPNVMTPKLIIYFVVDTQLIKYFKLGDIHFWYIQIYISTFETGNCDSNTNFKKNEK